MAEEHEERIQGVDMDELNAVLEDISYPITVDEFVDQYGDREIERTNADPISLQALFDEIKDDTYESPDEIRQMVLTLMPRDSVGRPQYSDRGGSHPVETRDADRLDEEESM